MPRRARRDIFADAKVILRCRAVILYSPSKLSEGQYHSPQGEYNWKSTCNCKCFFMEAPPRIELGNEGFADLCLTAWLWRQRKIGHEGFSCPTWSGLRGSNPPPRPWQGRALPNELNPHSGQCRWCLRSESNQRHEDFQSSALPTELQRQIKGGVLYQNWRPGWGSNPRPLAWQASVLTNWTTGPYWWKL